MPTNIHTAATAKVGTNYVRDIVERSGSIFHKIDTENDFGIDATIELFEKDKPLHKHVALQIKSGKSYYSNGKYRIPIGTHREYWAKYPLPVLGVVYIPSLNSAHYTDIKSYLKQFPEATTITFPPLEDNVLNQETFSQILVPRIVGRLPNLGFEKSVHFAKSRAPSTRDLGIHSLFKHHINSTTTWDIIFEHFFINEARNIYPYVLYFIAHIPWHMDIFHSGEMITLETKRYAQNIISNFNKSDAIKLLQCVDENGFERGSIGQNVEAILLSLESPFILIESIIRDPMIDIEIRHHAAQILASRYGCDALPIIRSLASEGSWFADALIEYLQATCTDN